MGKIIDDKRVIKGLNFDGWGIYVGIDGVASITPYEENGDGAYITWFEVINVHGQIVQRVNSLRVLSVNY